jgi:hypothetical protein
MVAVLHRVAHPGYIALTLRLVPSRPRGGGEPPGKLLVADDALGGFFAWFDQPRTVHYLAPDTFEWEDTSLGYADWLAWCFAPTLAEFYGSSRREGWRAEVERLRGDEGLHVSPPLVMKEPPLPQRSRRTVSVEELLHFALDMQQLADLSDGATVTFKRGQ